MHANEGGVGGVRGERREGMSVRLLIRVFVFHYWVKRRESERKRGREKRK